MSPSELDAFRRGEHALFRRLVECHSPRLLTVALAYSGDSDEAHDAVQEVWLRAYQSREQLENAGSFLGWLLSISRNVGHSRGRGFAQSDPTGRNCGSYCKEMQDFSPFSTDRW